ncbi:MAG: hypothetical protein WBZ36_10235 [Candidatus Nitrosopolaris sp.]
MDVWWIGPSKTIGPDGFVYGNSWGAGDWQGKYQLDMPPGLIQSQASIRGGLAAVARDSANMDVWWIAPDGSVMNKSFSSNWLAGGNRLNGSDDSPCWASPSGGLAAVARDSANMEVFWIGQYGSVYGKSYVNRKWADGDPYKLAGDGSASNGLPSDTLW